MTSKAKWTGSLYFANGWAHYTGPAGDGDFHAHYVHQLVYAENEPATVHFADGSTASGAILFIPSNTLHQLQAHHEPLEILYIEPTLYEATANPPKTVNDWRSSLSSIEETINDPRIEKALTAIDQVIDQKIYADHIAKEAGLSKSHFNSLFRKATNIPLRRYVLWRRLNIAGLIVMQGGSVTDAAHTAGFSDAAHFNRTMKDTFGVSPTDSLINLSLTVAPGVTLPAP